jgi:hypothetical protein
MSRAKMCASPFIADAQQYRVRPVRSAGEALQRRMREHRQGSRQLSVHLARLPGSRSTAGSGVSARAQDPGGDQLLEQRLAGNCEAAGELVKESPPGRGSRHVEGISRPTVRRIDPSASTTTPASRCGSNRSGPPVGRVCVNSDTSPQVGFHLNACSVSLVPPTGQRSSTPPSPPGSATGETLKRQNSTARRSSKCARRWTRTRAHASG